MKGWIKLAAPFALGVLLSHVGVTYDEWEFYAIFATLIAYRSLP